MNKPSQVKVVQNPESPVATEVIAEAIVAISQGVKKMLAGPLNESALILLITNATPSVGRGYRKTVVSARAVKAVLAGMESLEREYLKPKKA